MAWGRRVWCVWCRGCIGGIEGFNRPLRWEWQGVVMVGRAGADRRAARRPHLGAALAGAGVGVQQQHRARAVRRNLAQVCQLVGGALAGVHLEFGAAVPGVTGMRSTDQMRARRDGKKGGGREGRGARRRAGRGVRAGAALGAHLSVSCTAASISAFDLSARMTTFWRPENGSSNGSPPRDVAWAGAARLDASVSEGGGTGGRAGAERGRWPGPARERAFGPPGGAHLRRGELAEDGGRLTVPVEQQHVVRGAHLGGHGAWSRPAVSGD
jgi:hypothetical protein